MLRAMHVLVGHGPQIQISTALARYDHPYFGQLFLAAIFKMIGYPDSLKPSIGNIHSIEMIYLVPRILMGIFDVVDTFLIYKIAERRYNRNVALFSSVLFAVMPMTWLLRWILLDNIFLPFLLSSILFTIPIKDYKTGSGIKNDKENKRNKRNKRKVVILFSGISLGLAIFTKISVLPMMGLVGFLVYKNSNDNRLRTLGLWFFAPVILIPLIWPAYALSIGQFKFWIDSIYFQTHRNRAPLYFLIIQSLIDDPVLLILGIAGIIFAAIKRDFLILLWSVPYFLFLYLIGHIQYLYVIPLLPIFCIAAGWFIKDLAKRMLGWFTILKKSINQHIEDNNNSNSSSIIIDTKKLQKIFPFAIILAIAIFGLVKSTMLIVNNNNINFPIIEATAFVSYYLQKSTNDIYNNNTITVSDGILGTFCGSNTTTATIISYPVYSWILKYVFHFNVNFVNYNDFSDALIKTRKIILITDWAFANSIAKKDKATIQIKKIYHLDNTNLILRLEDITTHTPISIYQLKNAKCG
jgi:hypothetical protein